MEKWEYKQIYTEVSPGLKWKKLQDFWQLQGECGQEGWELVSTTPINSYNGWTEFLILHFKRKIQE